MTSKLYDYYTNYLWLKSDRPFKFHGRSMAATRVRRVGDEAIAVVYHDTPIMTVDKWGKIVLNTGGWPTMTTRTRMQQALAPLTHHDIRVTGSLLRRGRLPRKPVPWQVVSVEVLNGEYVEDLITNFWDRGDIVPMVHVDYNSTFPVSPFDGKPGGGSIDDDRVAVQCAVFLESELI